MKSVILSTRTTERNFRRGVEGGVIETFSVLRAERNLKRFVEERGGRELTSRRF